MKDHVKPLYLKGGPAKNLQSIEKTFENCMLPYFELGDMFIYAETIAQTQSAFALFCRFSLHFFLGGEKLYPSAGFARILELAVDVNIANSQYICFSQFIGSLSMKIQLELCSYFIVIYCLFISSVLKTIKVSITSIIRGYQGQKRSMI